MGLQLSLLVVICEPQGPTWGLLLGFSVCPLGFAFVFSVSLYLGTVSPFRAKSGFVTLKTWGAVSWPCSESSRLLGLHTC